MAAAVAAATGLPLRLHALSKRFGDFIAVDAIDLDLLRICDDVEEATAIIATSFRAPDDAPVPDSGGEGPQS